MPDEHTDPEPWPPARLIYSVAGLIGALSGTLLFLWKHPGAAAAVEARLGLDSIPFLRGLIAVLALGWGLLVLKLPRPPSEQMGGITMVIILCAIAVVELAFLATAGG